AAVRRGAAGDGGQGGSRAGGSRAVPGAGQCGAGEWERGGGVPGQGGGGGAKDSAVVAVSDASLGLGRAAPGGQRARRGWGAVRGPRCAPAVATPVSRQVGGPVAAQAQRSAGRRRACCGATALVQGRRSGREW